MNSLSKKQELSSFWGTMFFSLIIGLGWWILYKEILFFKIIILWITSSALLIKYFLYKNNKYPDTDMQ